MSRRFCPTCGAPLTFSVQKFCTSCGTTLPDMPVAAPTPAATGSTGIPVWAIAVGALVILLVAGVILIPPLLQEGTSTSAGTTENGARLTISPAPSGTPITGATPATTTSTVQATFVPTTIPTTTVPTTTLTLTPPPTPTTTVPTPTPSPEPTSVITLAVTQAPPQPPVSSYTSSTPGAPYIDPFALEMRVHELINVQREQNGLAPLSYDPFLADIARGHSWDMATRNYFEHMNPEGLLARDRGNAAGYPCIRVVKEGSYNGISENILQGYRADASYTDASGNITSYDWKTMEEIARIGVDGWMASPGHRENILKPRYQIEGIGVAFSADDKIYITQNFC